MVSVTVAFIFVDPRVTLLAESCNVKPIMGEILRVIVPLNCRRPRNVTFSFPWEFGGRLIGFGSMRIEKSLTVTLR